MDRRQLDKYIAPSSVDAWCEARATTMFQPVFPNQLINDLSTTTNGSWTLDTKVTTGSDSVTVRVDAPTIYRSNTDISKEENKKPMKNEPKKEPYKWKKVAEVKRILYSGPATIVFWTDGTKTVVRCSENDIYDEYSAFCSALAIKLYGTNSHLKKVIERASTNGLQRSAN